jgi:DNA-binding MarR family transcriptional regulator
VLKFQVKSTRYADLKLQVKWLRLDFVTEISDGTPWLSDTELAAWMPFSAMLMGLPSALDAQLQRDAKLSLFGYFVLAGLSEAPERTLPMSYLAVLVGGSLSRLSHAVSSLERQGWVTRHPAPGGRRRTLATLTEAGYAKVVESAPAHVAAVRRLVIDPLTKQQLNQLGRVSETILTELNPTWRRLLDNPAPVVTTQPEASV